MAFCAQFFYSSQSSAQSSCGSCGAPGGPMQFGPANCLNLGDNTYTSSTRMFYGKGDDLYAYCYAGGPLIGPDQILDTNSGNLITCPSGTAPSAGQCLSVCPSGKVHANTVPSLNTSSTVCVTPGLDKCSLIGINPATDFVPKCSQQISGEPYACLDSDFTEFSILGCPTFTCYDGTTAQYPAVCPSLVVCAEGETKTKLPAGPEICVSNLPDKDSAPCVNIGSQPLCASDAQNCRQENGSIVCLAPAAAPVPGATCMSSSGQLYCITDQPVIQTSTQVVTNPDGTVTKTETASSNVKGTTPQTKTTTTNSSGTVTNTTSNFNSDLNQFTSLYQQQNKLDLSKLEKSSADTSLNTKNISDKLNDFMGGSNTITNESFDHSSVDSAKSSDESSLDSFVRGSNPFQAYYDAHGFVSLIAPYLPSNYNGNCVGGIHKVIFGHNFDFEPCERLLPLREILAWFFSILTAWQCINIATRTLTR